MDSKTRLREPPCGAPIFWIQLTTTSVVVVGRIYELQREDASDEYFEKAITTSLSLQSKALFPASRPSAPSAGAAVHAAMAANKAPTICGKVFMIDLGGQVSGLEDKVTR
jgi:hypothetical protein